MASLLTVDEKCPGQSLGSLGGSAGLESIDLQVICNNYEANFLFGCFVKIQGTKIARFQPLFIPNLWNSATFWKRF